MKSKRLFVFSQLYRIIKNSLLTVISLVMEAQQRHFGETCGLGCLSARFVASFCRNKMLLKYINIYHAYLKLLKMLSGIDSIRFFAKVLKEEVLSLFSPVLFFHKNSCFNKLQLEIFIHKTLDSISNNLCLFKQIK